MKHYIITSAIVLSSLANFSYAASCEKYKKFKCPGGETYPIHLTFDDGPHNRNTPKVLDALKKHNIKATFFVLAEQLEKKSQLKKKLAIMDRLKREGHIIGSHSYKHVTHTRLSDQELEKNVKRSKELLKDYLTEPYLFRLPYGDGWHPLTKNKDRAKNVLDELSDSGFTHVGWSLHASDWDRKKMKKPGILAIMMHQICENKGGVVLLHDIQSNTANNLSEWIDAIKCVGHEHVDISNFYGEDYVQLSKSEQESCESNNDSMNTGNLYQLQKAMKEVQKQCNEKE